jgi:hypothetical protein
VIDTSSGQTTRRAEPLPVANRAQIWGTAP